MVGDLLFRGCLEGYEDYESSHNNYVEATSLLGPSEAAVRLPLLLHRQQNDKLRASTEKKGYYYCLAARPQGSEAASL